MKGSIKLGSFSTSLSMVKKALYLNDATPAFRKTGMRQNGID
jgi:hypothetical protein